MSSIPEIVVSYGDRGDSTCVDIGVLPCLELRDEQVQEATDRLYSFLRSAFHLPYDSRLTLHETENGRILSKETFRDPSFVKQFPKYWYLTAENGYNAASIAPTFQSLSVEDSIFQSTEYGDLTDLLLMEGYSPTELNQVGFDEGEGEEEEEELGGMFPSLMELSMGQSPSLDLEESREDLETVSITCDKDGDFGTVFRHFTVVANVLSSDHSSSEGDYRSDSRSSAHSSSDSMFDTIRMSTLFVFSVSPEGPADMAGLQTGDIVSSVNGHNVTVSSTEELTTIIEESSKKIVLWVSPEKHDELLFLYPRYINKDPGEYDIGSNEKIFISDIVVRTQSLLSPMTEDREDSLGEEDTPLSHQSDGPNRTNKRVRPLSADLNTYSRISSARDQESSFHHLDVRSPLEGGSSEQSLSSGIEYNSSIEDLLIRGSLADIPVQPSPVQPRRNRTNDPLIKRISSAGLPNKIQSNGFDNGSQDWGQEDNRVGPPHWFPKADDEHQLTISLPVHNGSSSNEMMSGSGEFPSAFADPSSSTVSKKTKLTNKLRKTLKSLAGSTSSSSVTRPKLEKTNSLGAVKTSSTSAIDRLKINGTSSPSNLSTRSRSTDLGKIKLKRSSLEALTKVNSEESVIGSSQRRDATLTKQNSLGDQPNIVVQHPPMLNIETQIIPTLEFISTSQNMKDTESGPGGMAQSPPSIISNHSQGSPHDQLSLELGKSLSVESMSSSIGLRSGRPGGRSYRSQRQRLHQTKNPRAATGDSDNKDSSFTSSLVVTNSSTSLLSSRNETRPVRLSRDTAEYGSPSLTKKSPARRTSSWQNRNSYAKLSNESYSSQDKNYNFSYEDNLEIPAISSTLQYQQPHPHSHLNPHGHTHQSRQPGAAVVPHSPLIRSRSVNETSQGSEEGQCDRIAEERHTFTTSVDPKPLHFQQQRPHSSGGKTSTRRAMSIQPNLMQGNSLSCDNSGGYDNMNRQIHVPEPREKKPLVNQPVKINSVFHGPIHKKQEKDAGGKKSADRSWRSLYAAIQKHWMVFYNSIQDALANNPLAAEPALDLHQCVLKLLPNGYKNRKHIFRLTLLVDSSECLIQSENEESMMTWMRIIHNLNRMRIRMGHPLLGVAPHRSSTSTQEDLPKSQPKEKRKLQRIYTPQPPGKKKLHDKDDPSRRQQLLEILKRGIKKKEIVEDIDVPCYNTFGKPIEDCPASYENKSIPLVVMMCIQELEENWMDTEGLYRIAGPIGQVRTLAQDLNKGHFNLLQGNSDPHVITAVLKKFLKELPDPLVPLDLYHDFISCVQNCERKEQIEIMRGLVKALPPLHYHTLGFLIKHLTNIAAQSQVTKMNQHNLGIVFGPTVVHNKGGDDVVVTEMNASIATIKILMDNFKDFFSEVDCSAIQTNNSSVSNLTRPNSKNPFVRGKSDPSNSQNDYSLYGARSQSPRKSWDGTAISSINRGCLTAFSQDPFSLTGDMGNSQDPFRRGPHKKRLATSRGKLNYIEEPQKDPPSSMPPSAEPRVLSPVRHSSTAPSVTSPQRKISYTHAISRGYDYSSTDALQSVDEDTVDTSCHVRAKYPLNHQSTSHLYNNSEKKISVGGVYPPSQRYPRHTTSHGDIRHPRRWSAIDPSPQMEIIGPTSTDSDWMSRGFTTSIGRSMKQTYVAGPESCL